MADTDGKATTRNDSGISGTGLTAVGPPRVSSFGVEVLLGVYKKWPLPVFVLSLIAAGVFMFARPKAETLRPWQEYMCEARNYFSLAVDAQEEHGDTLRTVFLLAGERVNVYQRQQVERQLDKHSMVWRPTDALEQVEAIGDPSEGLVAFKRRDKWGYVGLDGVEVIPAAYERAGRFIDGLALVQKGKGSEVFIDNKGKEVDVVPVHGVLPSYARVIALVGESVLDAEDHALMGEALYYLAKIKRDEPNEAGRWLRPSAEKLFGDSAARLGAAMHRLERWGKDGETPVGWVRHNTVSASAHEAAVPVDGARWRCRRRMWAECQMVIGNYSMACDALDEVLAKMNVVEAGQLGAEKTVERGGDGAGVTRDSAEWARVYSLIAECHDRLNHFARAIEGYRLFLEQGTGGEIAHKARVRLGELLMAQFNGQVDVGAAQALLAEVLDLCRQVEESDARSDLREDAVFMRGRAAYRLGLLAQDSCGSRQVLEEAVSAFRHPFSPSGKYTDMSRVLLARCLALAGRRVAALELLDGILRVGAPPAIYACAEVSRADIYAGEDMAQAVGGRLRADCFNAQFVLREGKTVSEVMGVKVRALDDEISAALGLDRGGVEIVSVMSAGLVPLVKASGDTESFGEARVGDVIVQVGKQEIYDEADLPVAIGALKPGAVVSLSLVRPGGEQVFAHGYMNAISRINKLSKAEREALVPELRELIEAQHFILLAPDKPSMELPHRGAQLIRIARALTTVHDYDEAARIYMHILKAYPVVAEDPVSRDHYGFLLGEVYRDKAAWLARSQRRQKEHQHALIAAARAHLRVIVEAEHERRASVRAVDSCWLAARCYFDAGRYDGSVRALRRFVEQFGDDRRKGEALFLLGESLRNIGDCSGAADVFARCSVEHRNEQYGYLAHLALGETYLEMGLLDGEDSGNDGSPGGNAREVFETIRRDARYTPESQVWMKSLFRLGEVYFRIGRRDLMLGRAVKGVTSFPEAMTVFRRLLPAESIGKTDPVLVRSHARWLARLEEAVTNEKQGVAEKIEGEAIGNLRRAAEIIDEAMQRYPLEQEGRELPSRKFVHAQHLPCMRARAMIDYLVNELEEAERGFSKILDINGQVIGEDRAELDLYRREALTFLGIIQLRLNRPAEASRTFRLAYDEYARSADGPWYCLAAGLAMEKAGRKQEADVMYAQAQAGLRQAGERAGQAGAGGDPGESWPWKLESESWERHAQWVIGG